MSRVYQQKSIEELERLVDTEEPSILRAVHHELKFRSTSRSRKLLVLLESKLTGRVATKTISRKIETPSSETKVAPKRAGNDSSRMQQEGQSRLSPREDRVVYSRDQIEKLRQRLLDLTKRSRLLNYKFSETARGQIRVIDELPNQLFDRLQTGGQMWFRSIAEPSDEPKDEKSAAFIAALNAARIGDSDYVESLKSIGEEDPEDPKFRRIERDLKDRVRLALGLAARPTRATLSRAEIARLQGLDPSYELPTTSTATTTPASPKHTDNEIQTPLFPDEMERKLSALRDNTQKGLTEMGVNTLFAAYGFLEWYEADQSDIRLLAPLIMQPLELKRETKKGAYRYGVTGIGEEAQENLTLVERLKEFAITLPPLEQDETPEKYFHRIADVVKEKKRWKVHRFVVIGTFAFGKLAMWHDLNPDRWPDSGDPSTHPVVATLLAGSHGGFSTDADDHPVDTVEYESRLPLTITGVDTSQLSAIIDAMEGKNLVIKGPPGTGKSQTITNLIAAAMDSGKTVLFVAEKMAALDVVKRRLDGAGLGEFVLELHSTKARKTDLLGSIARRLEQRGEDPPERIADTRESVTRLKADLNGYVSLVNSRIGAAGKTVQEVLWAEARVRHVEFPRELDDVVLVNAVTLNPEDIARCRDTMRVLEGRWADAVKDFGTTEAHPWRGVRKALAPFDQQVLVAEVSAWKQEISECREALENLRKLVSIDEQISFNSLVKLAESFTGLPKVDDPLVKTRRPELIAFLENSAVHEQAIALNDVWIRLEDLENKLAGSFEKPDVVTGSSNLLDRVLSELRMVDGGSTAASEIRKRIEDAETQRTTWNTIRDGIHEITEAAGLKRVNRQPDLAALRDAAGMVLQTPRRALELRFSALADEESGNLLDRLETDSNRLAKQRTELVRILRLDAASDPMRLRGHAAVLTNTNFFARLFSTNYKAARAYHRSLTGTSTKPSDAAGQLLRCAEFMEHHRKFCDDREAKTTLGAFFEGLDTDFQRIREARRYCRFAAELGRRPQVGQGIKKFLMGGSEEQILEFADNVAANIHYFEAALRVLVNRPTSTIDDVAEGAEKSEESWKTLLSLTAQMGVRPSVLLGQLQSLAEIAESHRNIVDKELRRLTPFSTVIEPLGFAKNNATARNDALQLAAALSPPSREFGVDPQAFRTALFVVDLEDKLAAIHEQSAKLLRASADCLARGAKVISLANLDFSSAFGVESWFGAERWQDAPLSLLQNWTDTAFANSSALAGWVNWLRARADVESEGLGGIVSCLQDSKYMNTIALAFERVVWRSLVRKAFEDHPRLERFSGMAQEKVRARFRELDARLLELNRKKIRSNLLAREAPAGASSGKPSDRTDMALLVHHSQLQKPRIAIRKLIEGSHDALQVIKPCWMMSPSSVAQFLPAGEVRFDLIVIDEASQMRPEESLGALARGSQVVIVGDMKQLPPTSFFDRLLESDDEGEEEDVNAECILELALSAFHPARNLNFHYRSRHESLISFSNKEFYESKLTVFPSPAATSEELGVKYRYVNGTYAGHVNQKEVTAVAEAAVAHMQSTSPLSLGVVAVNRAQADLLRAEIDRLVLQDVDAQKYLARWEGGLEEFFVRNLETVQGDERDVIMISTVYGPNAQGVVHQRFGPINSNVGHRRLNVLFTRAKHRLELFTSLTSDSIRPTEQPSEGVRALKHYLEFAATGRIESGTDGGGEPDSDFEVFVANALRRHDFDVRTQVGVAGFRIDLGVKHRSYPHGYILGVECDGASYHSAKSARDRDALRQSILEGLGWSLYRVWSTDWFRDPRGETEKLVRVLNDRLRAIN